MDACFPLHSELCNTGSFVCNEETFRHEIITRFVDFFKETHLFSEIRLVRLSSYRRGLKSKGAKQKYNRIQKKSCHFHHQLSAAVVLVF